MNLRWQHIKCCCSAAYVCMCVCGCVSWQINYNLDGVSSLLLGLVVLSPNQILFFCFFFLNVVVVAVCFMPSRMLQHRVFFEQDETLHHTEMHGIANCCVAPKRYIHQTGSTAQQEIMTLQEVIAYELIFNGNGHLQIRLSSFSFAFVVFVLLPKNLAKKWKHTRTQTHYHKGRYHENKANSSVHNGHRQTDNGRTYRENVLPPNDRMTNVNRKCRVEIIQFIRFMFQITTLLGQSFAFGDGDEDGGWRGIQEGCDKPRLRQTIADSKNDSFELLLAARSSFSRGGCFTRWISRYFIKCPLVFFFIYFI